MVKTAVFLQLNADAKQILSVDASPLKYFYNTQYFTTTQIFYIMTVPI